MPLSLLVTSEGICALRLYLCQVATFCEYLAPVAGDVQFVGAGHLHRGQARCVCFLSFTPQVRERLCSDNVHPVGAPNLTIGARFSDSGHELRMRGGWWATGPRWSRCAR